MPTLKRNTARLLIIGAAVFGLATLTYNRFSKPQPLETPGTSEARSAALPELTRSPFLNTNPETKYVGDASCVVCHRSLCDSYHDVAMGRSLFTISGRTPVESFDEKAGNPFRADNLRFEVLRQGDKLIHRGWCPDSTGRVAAELKVEMDYAIGSGTQARSYIYKRDGFLFQSPITWYKQTKAFQLSPGFDKVRFNFARRVDSACLYCHCNIAHPVPNTLNRYQEPVFGQLAIGCERCHGPGEQHVASRRQGIRPPDIDYTIVNPKRLSPQLREAICQQCHLQGEAIVERRGRSQTDYRPGLPLHEYVSVFVRPSDFHDSRVIVSHVEQMHQSVCYNKSGGKFDCVSCHDPHYSPRREEKVAFFKDRCLNCHSNPPRRIDEERWVHGPSCSEPISKRLAKDASDNCLACHMPRNPSSNATHLAVTDHRVLRVAGVAPLVARTQRDSSPLVDFHQILRDSGDEESRRDLGVAIVHLATQAKDAGDRVSLESFCRRALPLLESAVARAPDDLAAVDALGFVLCAVGRPDEALRFLQGGLVRAPGREQTLTLAAEAAQASDRLDLAEEYSRRLVEGYPRFPGHPLRLAIVLGMRNAWSQALEAAETAVRLDPLRAEVHALLIAPLLETGNLARARAEFAVVGAIDPDYQSKIRPWFEERIKRAK